MYILCLFTFLALSDFMVRSESLQELCGKPKNEVECGKQVWEGHPIDGRKCQVKFYPTNSSECSNIVFKEGTDEELDIGNVMLKPFFWTYKNATDFTVFNITFSKIMWDRFKFRYEISGKGSVIKNHCRNIILQGISQRAMHDVLPSLNYDCFWSMQDHIYENQTYTFEFLAEKDGRSLYKRYKFVVPPTNTLNPFPHTRNWYPFFYLDVTKKNEIFAHIVSHHAVIVDKYLFNVCFKKDIKDNQNCQNYEVTPSNDKETIYSYYLKESGFYTFNLITLSPNCTSNECTLAKGPDIIFDNKVKENTLKLIYSILGTLVSIILFFSIFIWLKIRTNRIRNKRINILLIYPQCSHSDEAIIINLCDYLRNKLYMNLETQRNILETDHGDPYTWFEGAFEKANIVLNINVPEASEQITSSNVYQKMDEILLKFLHNHISNVGKIIVNLHFDHNKGRPIRKEFTSLKKFYIPSQMRSFLYYILQFNWIDSCIHPLPKYDIYRTANVEM